MSKEEYLRGLEEALKGEVPGSVIRDNLNYYNSYLSQEISKRRTMEDIISEIGEPRIVARTIIDSCEAAGETEDGYGSYEDTGFGDSRYDDSRYDDGRYSSSKRQTTGEFHYIDLNKWYWKLLAIVLLFLVIFVVFQIVGGIFLILMRFAGPILLAVLLIWFIRGLRQ